MSEAIEHWKRLNSLRMGNGHPECLCCSGPVLETAIHHPYYCRKRCKQMGEKGVKLPKSWEYGSRNPKMEKNHGR